MKAMSELYARPLSAPTVAIRLVEPGWTGRFEMSSFHGLSGGKTWSAERMRSASGVLNMTGRVIRGIGGRSRPRDAWRDALLTCSAPLESGSRRPPVKTNTAPIPKMMALKEHGMTLSPAIAYDG